MKLTKLNFSGIAHYILPLFVVLGVGAVGTIVFQASHANSDNCTNHLYSSGSSGACVKDIQKILNLQVAANLKVDGAFGSLTKAAVVKAQGVAGITKDGIVGPNTWRAMCSNSKMINNQYAKSMQTRAHNNVISDYNKALDAACLPKYHAAMKVPLVPDFSAPPPTSSGKLSCSISGPSNLKVGESWTPTLTVTSTYNKAKTLQGGFAQGTYTNSGSGAGGAPTISITVPANGKATKTGSKVTAVSGQAGKGGFQAAFEVIGTNAVKCSKKVAVVASSSSQSSSSSSSSKTATLTCSNWEFTPNKPQLGKTFKASAKIKNTGNSSFKAAFMLVFAVDSSGKQTVLGQDTTNSGTLASGASRTTSASITVPKAAKNAKQVFVGFNTSVDPSSNIQQKSDNSCVSKIFSNIN